MSTAEMTDQPKAEAERTNEQRREWSRYVNVGPGAADCTARLDGSCTVEDHFHAWCHLPNPFQVRDIVMKARAAAARHRQMLRDENSDARIVLEEELYSLQFAIKEILVDEVVDKDFPTDYVESEAAVRMIPDENHVFAEDDDDDKEPPKLFEHIDQDREEYERQAALPEEQREPDFEVLQGRVAHYGECVEEAMQKRRAPRREALMQEDQSRLIEIIRRDRMERAATEVYLHTHASWTWYVCTLKPVLSGRPKERIWGTITEMRQEAEPEVVVALRNTFDDLESQMGRGDQGNS